VRMRVVTRTDGSSEIALLNIKLTSLVVLGRYECYYTLIIIMEFYNYGIEVFLE